MNMPGSGWKKQRRLAAGLAACVVLAVAAAAMAWGTKKDSPAGEQPWEQAAVWISCDTGSGNGVIVWAQKGEYVLATAAHVTGEAPEHIFVCGIQTEDPVCYVSSEYDLAFVRFRLADAEAVSFARQAADLDGTGYEALEDGDELRIFGFLQGEGKLYTGRVLSRWIYMEDFGYHMLWGEMGQMQGGLSGSGVFDGKGRLVGILCGGGGENEIAVLPANMIAAEWQRVAPAGRP